MRVEGVAGGQKKTDLGGMGEFVNGLCHGLTDENGH